MPRAVLTSSPCFLRFFSHPRADREAVADAVQQFLKSCQPFFNKLEAVARDTTFRSNPLPYSVYATVDLLKEVFLVSAHAWNRQLCSKKCTKHRFVLVWGLEFVDVSQQLCDRLKQLLLTCESSHLLSLADSDPLGYTGPVAQLFSLPYAFLGRC